MKKIWTTADSEGRVELGEEFANRLVRVEVISETEAVVKIPAKDDPEAWFYGPEARAMVQEGAEAARAGRFAEAPDFSIADDMADLEDCEDAEDGNDTNQ